MRSSDDPRPRARMLDFICQKARQHHERYEEAYSTYQLKLDFYSFRDVVACFRDPFTGEVRPKKRATAELQRSDLLNTNVNRVINQMYCQLKEEFRSLPSFSSRVEEQFSIPEERATTHNAEIEKQ